MNRQTQSMNGPLTAVSLATGAIIGFALHVAWEADFSWWFVLGSGIAGFFAVAAYVRRHRWEERSTCAALAALVLTLPLVGGSWWFLLCTVLLMLTYWWLLSVEEWKRERQR